MERDAGQYQAPGPGATATAAALCELKLIARAVPVFVCLGAADTREALLILQ